MCQSWDITWNTRKYREMCQNLRTFAIIFKSPWQNFTKTSESLVIHKMNVLCKNQEVSMCQSRDITWNTRKYRQMCQNLRTFAIIFKSPRQNFTKTSESLVIHKMNILCKNLEVSMCQSRDITCNTRKYREMSQNFTVFSAGVPEIAVKCSLGILKISANVRKFWLISRYFLVFQVISRLWHIETSWFLHSILILSITSDPKVLVKFCRGISKIFANVRKFWLISRYFLVFQAISRLWHIETSWFLHSMFILYITRGVSPDNVNFCQPVIIGNQFNFTFILPIQKTSIRTKVMDDHKDKVKKPLKLLWVYFMKEHVQPS